MATRTELTAAGIGEAEDGPLDELMNGVQAGWPASTLERLIVKGLARRFHTLNDVQRRALIERRPKLTRTPWDAVIAATVEHVCWTHGWPQPAWTEEEERFEPRPWAARRGPIEQRTALGMCPAAFIRHNVFIDPRVLDERTGDNAWVPDESTDPGAVHAPERQAGSPRSDG